MGVNLDAVLDRGARSIGDDPRTAARRFAPRVIRHPDGSPYLTRYYLLGGPLTPNPWDRHGKPKRHVRWPKTSHGLYLHHFHASDLDQLHNHPWTHAASLILTGGYLEHRPEGTTQVNPGDRTYLTRDTYHRVELLEDDAWTLFAVGPFAGTWQTKPPLSVTEVSRTW